MHHWSPVFVDMLTDSGKHGSLRWNAQRQHVADYMDPKSIWTEESFLLLCHRFPPASPNTIFNFQTEAAHCSSMFPFLPTLPRLSCFFQCSSLTYSQVLFLVWFFFLPAFHSQTRESIVLPKMPWSPGPSMPVCSVSVSQLENSCHIQPSHAAQLRFTASVAINSFSFFILSYVTQRQTWSR